MDGSMYFYVVVALAVACVPDLRGGVNISEHPRNVLLGFLPCGAWHTRRAQKRTAMARCVGVARSVKSIGRSTRFSGVWETRSSLRGG